MRPRRARRGVRVRPLRGGAGDTRAHVALPVAPLRRGVALAARGRKDPAPARVPHAAGGVPEHRRPRRRRGRPRAARRGLSRTRLLGRVVLFVLLHRAASRDRAGAAAVPLPPAGRRAPGRPRGGLRRRHVPVAERQRRQRGDPEAAPQPQLRPLAGRQQPPATARQHRHRLQRVALLQDHRRPGISVPLRRRNDSGDRALLGQLDAGEREYRALRDPRRHGSGRVP